MKSHASVKKKKKSKVPKEKSIKKKQKQEEQELKIPLLALLVFLLIFVEAKIVFRDPATLGLFARFVGFSEGQAMIGLADLPKSVEETKSLSSGLVWEKRDPGSCYPKRNSQTENFKTDATSVLVYDLDKRKILFEKSINKELPIASLTKLMTALVVIEEGKDLTDKWLTFNQDDLSVEGSKNIFRDGEEYKTESLLKALLISSSNESAQLLARSLEESDQEAEDFSQLMNEKAIKLELENTNFSNPVGLDGNNFSTARDLLKISQAIVSHENKIFGSTKLAEETIYSKKERAVKIKNTNGIISSIPDLLLSKTGHTDLAKDCMLIVKEFQQDRVLLIILGADNRDIEMTRLIDWTGKAYIFD